METASQTLHRLTWAGAFDLERQWDPPVADSQVVTGFEPNDMGRFPWFFKRYEAAGPLVPLPRVLPPATADAVAVLSGTAQVDPRPLDLTQLARLLFLSAGVVRVAERNYGPFYFRAAGSAGGRFPMELYVLAPEGYELPPGIHWYHPLEHALLPIGPPPAGSAPALLVTGVPWRTGWRYRERGYRHIYWDTGSMLAQLLAAADSAGIPAGLYSRFPDQDMAALVGTDGIHEWPVALVSLGDTAAPQLRPSGPARSGQVDAAPIEFPLATNAQHAGDLGAMGPAWGRGVPVPSFEPCGQTIDEVVLKRGSQRLMDPSKVLPHVVLSGVELALRDIDVAHFVAVHGVEGVPPGIYRWPDLASPIRPGLLRDELYRVCMNQSLGYDAAFILMAAADVAALDDRQYREAHLAAGLASGRMHLIAYAYGAGASGMTFVDGLIPDLLGEDLCGILFTCVGVPEYRSTPGGRPGEPATVRTVAPRLDNH